MDRFRFVSAGCLARRLGVSVQQARGRLRRLAARGLVDRARAHRAEDYLWFATSKGSLLTGGERRRAPRAEVQREHELAIVELVASLGRDHPQARVLTERECRHAERLHPDDRFSVELASDRFGSRRHWPDTVLLDGDERVAFEVELTAKSTPRLTAILAGYRDSTYTTVRYLSPTRPLPPGCAAVPTWPACRPWLPVRGIRRCWPLSRSPSGVLNCELAGNAQPRRALPTRAAATARTSGVRP
jgi:hypothetical protein